MTEVELVATALATGAAAGLTDTPRGVVHDLHAVLREAVRRRLTGDGVRSTYGVRVLTAYDTDPDVWRTRLLQVLASELELDEEILGAARAVLRADRRTGHAIVDVVGAPPDRAEAAPLHVEYGTSAILATRDSDAVGARRYAMGDAVRSQGDDAGAA